MGDLSTDLRRASTGALKHGDKKSALTSLIRRSTDVQSPWLVAAEQLSQFPTKRCVQMLPADWQELSSVLSGINRLCNSAKQISAAPISTSNSPASCPGFISILELLLRLGQVTSCLLCVNGDDRSFSIARVAQVSQATREQHSSWSETFPSIRGHPSLVAPDGSWEMGWGHSTKRALTVHRRQPMWVTA